MQAAVGEYRQPKFNTINDPQPVKTLQQWTDVVAKSYDGCAMRVVFSKLQNCADFNNGDFRDGGSAFQHLSLIHI